MEPLQQIDASTEPQVFRCAFGGLPSYMREAITNQIYFLQTEVPAPEGAAHILAAAHLDDFLAVASGTSDHTNRDAYFFHDKSSSGSNATFQEQVEHTLLEDLRKQGAVLLLGDQYDELHTDTIVNEVIEHLDALPNIPQKIGILGQAAIYGKSTVHEYPEVEIIMRESFVPPVSHYYWAERAD